MNALLNINIRVNSAAANAQVNQLRNNLNTLNSSVGSSMGGLAGFNTSLGRMSGLERFGKNLQWTGRQLEFNFTLPLVLAGGAATKFALDNERAMVGVRKVYGDLEDDAAMLSAELNALAKSFELLSTRFGVHQAEVIEIASAWAQAGAAGVGLAKATRLTLEAMILGEMDSVRATEGVIAVQAAYRLSTDQLRDALGQLNIIENQTSISFSGLIDVITRAGGSARSAGIDLRHLAAMAATLVPATGSATQAGNALRTIISRLMAPTQDSADVLALMGLNIYDASWQASNGTQRFEMLARAFDGLTQSQKTVVSSFVASRWQVNRFDILLGDLALALNEATRSQSVYAKALEATGGAIVDEADRLRVNAVYARELSVALSSTPKAFDILTNSIRNSMAKAILPMLPAIVGLLAQIAKLLNWFSQLDPGVQQLTLSMLLLLAAIGFFTRYLGSFILLFTTLAKGLAAVRALALGLTSSQIALAGATNVANMSLLRQHGILGLLFISMWRLIRLPFNLIGAALLSLGPIVLYLSRAVLAFGTVLGRVLGVGMAAAARAGVAGVVASMVGMVTTIARVIAGLPAILVQVGAFIRLALAGAFTGFTVTFITAARTITLTWYGLSAVLTGVWMTTTAALSRMWMAFVLFLQRTMSLRVMFAGLVSGATRAFILVRLGFAGLVSFVVRAAPLLGRALLSPWGLAVAAIAVILYALRRQIRQAVEWIIREFARLPQAILNIAKAVWRALQYINPFARHSPSLVDSVRLGVNTILDEFERLNGIADVIYEAIEAFEAFNAATAGGTREARMLGYQKDKEDILAVSPNAGPQIDRLIDSIFQMEEALQAVGEEIRRQEQYIEDWADSIEAAMKPINDAIFENEMAQKRLRLEILKLEQAGHTADEFKDKMAAIAGEMEMLRAESTELRLAGAGSDILGNYDSQLATLEAEHNALQGMKSPIEDLQDQLRELQIQEEIMRLERDLEFDPQLRALDEERKKLDDLKNGYRDIESAINDMEAALRQAAAASRELTEARKPKEEELSRAEELFLAAGEGDFEVPGGETVAGLGREGGLPDIEAFNEELQKELDAALADMGKIDIFGPIKDAWKKAWGWIKDNVGPYVQPAIEAIQGFFEGRDWGKTFGPINTAFDAVGTAIKWTWDNILQPVFSTIGDMIKRATDVIGPELAKWAPLWSKAVEAVQHVWNVISFVVGAIVALIVKAMGDSDSAFRTGWDAILAVVKFVWDIIVDVIKIALQIIRGVISLVLDLINGDFGKVFGDIMTIVDAAWDFIYLVTSTVLKVIFNIVEFILGGVWDVFKVAARGIQNVWDFMWGAVKWAWDNIGEPVFKAIGWFIEHVLVPAFRFGNRIITEIWNGIANAIRWAWDHVISPTFNWFKEGIDRLADSLNWFKDHVVDPVWNGIKEIIKGTWNVIAGIIEGGINGFIKAFNLLARGINIITDAINFGPTLSMMDEVRIPRFAKGGIPAYDAQGSGGIFNRATAIIGEGSKVYPEYVIPTDPRYRSNAERLYTDLSTKLFASGGVVGQEPRTGDGLGDFIEGAVNIGKSIVGGGFGVVKAFWDLMTKLPGLIRSIVQEIPKGAAKFIGNNVIDWAKNLIKEGIFKDKDELGGNPGWQKMWEILKARFPWATLYSAYRPGSVTVSGNQSYHSLGRAIDVDPSTDIAEWIRGTYRQSTKELIYSPMGNRQLKDGSDYFYTGAVRDMHWDHVHWAMAKGGLIPYSGIPSLADGGIIMPRPGGTLIRAGERGQAEMVKPLPHDMSGGDTHYHFYGDLEFPNVTKPSDAQKFLENLTALAGS